MVKRTYLLIMCIMCALFLWGQVVLEKALLLPVNGDKVDRLLVEAVETGTCGREAVWDMSHAIVVEDGCTMRFFNSGDSVVARVEGKQQFVYEIKGDSVILRSQETALSNLADSLPALKMVFPLAYGDSIYSPVYYRGKYSGNNAIATAGTYSMVVDGEGTLILPDDTIRNVLRIHERFDTKVNVSPWAKERIINADEDSLMRHVCDTYSWYSSDFRYPLAQITKDIFYNGASVTREDQTAYLCPPETQLYALGDVRQQRQMQTPQTPNNIGGYGYNSYSNSNINEQMLAYKANAVTVNVVDGNVNVTTNANGGMNSEVILSDLQGRVYGSSNGKMIHYFDTSRLPHGEYLLYVNDGENVRTERINVK